MSSSGDEDEFQSSVLSPQRRQRGSPPHGAAALRRPARPRHLPAPPRGRGWGWARLPPPPPPPSLLLLFFLLLVPAPQPALPCALQSAHTSLLLRRFDIAARSGAAASCRALTGPPQPRRAAEPSPQRAGARQLRPLRRQRYSRNRLRSAEPRRRSRRVAPTQDGGRRRCPYPRWLRAFPTSAAERAGETNAARRRGGAVRTGRLIPYYAAAAPPPERRVMAEPAGGTPRM